MCAQPATAAKSGDVLVPERITTDMKQDKALLSNFSVAL